MRTAILVSVPVLCFAVSAAAQDSVQHDLLVTLEPETHRIGVRDQILLPERLRRAAVSFTLSSALSIQTSEPAATRLGPEARGEIAVRYVFETIPADGVVRLEYSGRYDFGLSDQKEEYTRGFRETVGTLGPEGVYLDGDSRWVPGFGDGLIDFDVEVHMPPDWHVISQGSGSSRNADGRASWSSDGPMEQVYLVGGPLSVGSESAGAVEALVYLHQWDEALARKYLDATARYLEMYRGLIGPYPYAKFALVENFWETGYGMPSFTLLGPQVIRFPFILTSSYPHEILHNWWGNSVFVDYESGNWCEGLTAYMADHLIQEQRGLGAEYRRGALQKYRNYVREGRDFPLSEFRSRHSASTEAVGYGKALMVFHMLRRRLGDEDFRAGLADFYRKHRGRRASFSDLRDAMAAVSEQDLGPFFAQWIERPGAPKLVLESLLVRAEEGEFSVTGSLRQIQAEEPWALEVPVVVRSAEGRASFVVETRASSTPFELRVAGRPLSVSVDPEFDVFRHLDPRETPASIGQIFGDPRVLAVLPAADTDAAERERYRELAGAWQSDEHHLELTLDTELEQLPDDRSVWILGRKNRFAQAWLALGADVEDSGSSLTIAGDELTVADHTFVLIARQPRNPDKAVGWIAIEPPAAFPGLARKLPHYGKYSYLAFEDDDPTNVLKGQWQTDDSPLVVDIDPAARKRPALAAETRPALALLPPVFSQRGLAQHVAWLAAPERDGRGLGTPGLEAAADYIAERMRTAGLAPGGDDGTWFQHFTVPEGPDGVAVTARNVVGVLPGTRADWGEQSIVFSAHYDHLGRGWPDVHAGDEGRIHPGADDNASGVAVLLELARNLAAEGSRSRNLVVVAFSAEECGRLGSRHYLEHPRFPIEGIRGVINLDTVGRLFDGKLAIHGTGTADEWQHIFRGAGFVTGIESTNVPGGAEGSDQMSFIERGIPGVQIFTGAHTDYHRPGDTPERVDQAGLVKVATFVKEAVTYMLEREQPLSVRIEGAAPASAPTGTGRKVRFGSVPEFAFQGVGVKIASVIPDSPAARAGILAGDVLVRLADQDIADLRAFSRVLEGLQPGQEVQVSVLREGTEVSASVVVEAR